MSETVNKVAVLSSAVKHALLADVQYYDFHASSAFNRKMKGIITPGFYGGFEPALAGGLNLKITSLQGPGGHGVASVDVNNHQITVQQIEDVTLAIPVNGVTRVMLEANYQYGVKTSQVDDSSDIHAARIFTANISVPLADNHLEICRVTVPADATELTLDMIDSSHRRNKALGITLSSEIDSDADHIGASSHAVKKAVKAARDETEKQIEELVDNAPASLDTLKKIADAINNDPDFFNTLNAVLALKAPLHDPALTGIATVPTPPLSVSNKQIANTEFVQAAVAALVGSSPEALDTLAELAEALGNDPNFATTMLNKLAGKQPLDSTLTNLSGKDVAGLLQYLGLVETINRAAGSLQKDQNGADVPQPDWFVRNIGAARAFSGGISIGGGGNWTTAEFIVWLENQGAFNHPYWMCKGSWSYSDNRTITDTGCGNIQLAGAVVEVMGDRVAMTIRVTTASTGGGTLSAQFTYINHGDDYSPGWRRDLKRSGDTMLGELKIHGANALRIFDEQRGLIFRRSEESLHLIPTLENQGENGDIGPLRPLSINLRTGEVMMEQKLLASGGAQISSSLGIGVDNVLGENSIVLGDADTGLKQNGDGVLDSYSNGRQVMRIVPGAVQVFGWTGSWIDLRRQPCFTNVTPVDNDGASAIVRQEHHDRHFIIGGLGNNQFGIYMINKSRTANGSDGQAFMNTDADWVCGNRVLPGNYENFDARYQPKDNYATQAWVSQNFVQNIRQSGVAYIDAEKNSGQRLVPAGGVLIGSQVNGEWDNNEGFYYTWIQQNINGNWLTIGRV
ncbi:hypothetical protein [Citrobacter braakii]|uniref:hypothetical protein n=1 Tax=Citrobacter braakii TaxID=57706 RepID=UPI002180CA37|nr:hypothetical protein [Citrobacter braakii]